MTESSCDRDRNGFAGLGHWRIVGRVYPHRYHGRGIPLPVCQRDWRISRLNISIKGRMLLRGLKPVALPLLIVEHQNIQSSFEEWGEYWSGHFEVL